MKNKVTIITMILLITLTSLASAEKVDIASSLNDIEEMIDYIDQNYYKDVDKEELIEGAYRGVFSALDKHSTYMSAEEYYEFTKTTDGSYVGVGIVVEPKGENIHVVNLYEGAPAQKSGIDKGDLIVEIDGHELEEVGYLKGLDLLLGESGSKVGIGFTRNELKDRLYCNVVRERIKLNSVEHKVLENEVGYIKIVEFSKGTFENFVKTVDNLKSEGVTEVVLDLRDNPGGLLNEALKICDYMVAEGKPLLYLRSRETLSCEVSRKEAKKLDLVVLVNDNSASASEIVAGVLQSYGLAKIIGEVTYGKGTVQSFVELEGNRGAYKLTILDYLLPNKVSIDGVGVVPDFVVPKLDNSKNDIIGNLAPMPEIKTYNLGEIGLNVFGAEQRLTLLGYDIKIDGVMDKNMVTALESFQNNYNIEGNGELNDESITKLSDMSLYVKEGNDVDLQLERAIYVLKNY